MLGFDFNLPIETHIRVLVKSIGTREGKLRHHWIGMLEASVVAVVLHDLNVRVDEAAFIGFSIPFCAQCLITEARNYHNTQVAVVTNGCDDDRVPVCHWVRFQDPAYRTFVDILWQEKNLPNLVFGSC